MITQKLKHSVGEMLKQVISRLPKENQLGLVNDIAPRLGITSIGAKGEHGEIYSTSTDRCVLKEYILGRSWGGRTNALLTNFFGDKGGGYVDVGANIGLTTIPVAKKRNVSCIAVEPDPVNFGHLRLNIMKNCPEGSVELHEAAVCTQKGTIDLQLSSWNMGDHRIKLSHSEQEHGERKRQTVKVRTVALYDIANELTAPLAIKIDTQGAEPEVVASGVQTLKRADLAIIEFDPRLMALIGSDVRWLIHFLRDNFSTLRIAIGETGQVSQPTASERVCAQLDQIATGKSAGDTYLDIIAIRSEQT